MPSQVGGLRPGGPTLSAADGALDLPRAYRVIYICGSFGLTVGREHDLEALHR